MISHLAGALEVSGIKPLEKLVLIMMANAADMDGECYLPVDDLARQCGCSVALARKAVDALIVIGWLRDGAFNGSWHGVFVCTEDDE